MMYPAQYNVQITSGYSARSEQVGLLHTIDVIEATETRKRPGQTMVQFYKQAGNHLFVWASMMSDDGKSKQLDGWMTN